MNAAHWHVVLVHIPIVGAFFALVTLAAGAATRSEALFRLGSAFAIFVALAAAASYFTGGEAYDLMKPDVDEALVESHALIARVGFIVAMLTGAVALVGLLQEAQGERPSIALRYVLTLAMGMVVWVMFWAAHLGGRIRHPEARGVDFFFFPSF